MLDFDNDRYWTSTKYENEEGVVRGRLLNENDCYRHWDDPDYDGRVCGFKDSMQTAKRAKIRLFVYLPTEGG